MIQLENFLTNTRKPCKNNLWITLELWVSVLKRRFFFLKLRFNDLTILVGQYW